MISTVVELQLIEKRNRWDFAPYNPDYEQVIEIIQDSKWEYSLLKDLVESFNYGMSVPTDYIDTGICILSTQNIREYSIDISDVRYISENTPYLNKYRLEPSDILMTRDGFNIGNAAVISKTIAGSVHSSHTIRLRPLENKVSSAYLTVVLNSSLLKIQIFALKRGSVHPNINIAELEALQIPVPPLHIQKQIANEMQQAYAEATRLRAAAEKLVTEVSARVERMILGEEEVT